MLKLKDEKGEEYNGFIVTLLSDSILRDDDLRPLKFITDEVLKNYGINDAVIINKIYSNNIIQSYSGTSGLRRFSDIAVTKGSLFLVRYDGREDISSKLKKLETEGIGFRKHEGFGKVIINNPIHLTTFNKENQLNLLSKKRGR